MVIFFHNDNNEKYIPMDTYTLEKEMEEYRKEIEQEIHKVMGIHSRLITEE